MGFLRLDSDFNWSYRQLEESFRGTHLGVGCLKQRHFQLKRGWSDKSAKNTKGGGCCNNNQQQVPSVITSSWMTPSRIGCDHVDFRTSGNTSLRAMTHQVQV